MSGKTREKLEKQLIESARYGIGWATLLADAIDARIRALLGERVGKTSGADGSVSGECAPPPVATSAPQRVPEDCGTSTPAPESGGTERWGKEPKR